MMNHTIFVDSSLAPKDEPVPKDKQLRWTCVDGDIGRGQTAVATPPIDDAV